MNTRLYLANLSYSLDESDLRRTFESFGSVRSVVVNRGQSRGFGFVEYENATDALRASESLDGCDVGGRRLSVRVQRVSQS